MKVKFRLILCVLSLMSHFTIDVQAAEMMNTVNSILRTENLGQLAAVAGSTRESARKRRACEVQRSEKIAPTLCYPESAVSARANRELDSACRVLSLKANRLPEIDRYTSANCRAALERRARDLAYAAGRDALR